MLLEEEGHVRSIPKLDRLLEAIFRIVIDCVSVDGREDRCRGSNGGLTEGAPYQLRTIMRETENYDMMAMAAPAEFVEQNAELPR
jgi:hypothetical protein